MYFRCNLGYVLIIKSYVFLVFWKKVCYSKFFIKLGICAMKTTWFWRHKEKVSYSLEKQGMSHPPRSFFLEIMCSYGILMIQLYTNVISKFIAFEVFYMASLLWIYRYFNAFIASRGMETGTLSVVVIFH